MLAEKSSYVRGIRFSRNFGQHAAIMAGLRASRGDVAVIMDCDMQDPPEVVPRFLEALEHTDVAIGVRGGPKSAIRVFESRIFTKVMQLLTGTTIDTRQGGIVGLTRVVIDNYCKINEVNHHLLSIVRWLGFPQVEVEYERMQRQGGRSSYSLRKRIAHGLSGLLFESIRLLQLIASIGVIIALAGFGLAILVIIRAIVYGSLSGWPSLISVLLVFSGVTILLQAVIGGYVAKTFEQSRNRTLFVVVEDTSSP
jgi:dolichol-phosphate mannosyltransferase